MDIKASDIKNLREKTGAGMMDCKKALAESNGDFSAAEKLLREWGMAGVEKRAARATNEGRIFTIDKGNAMAIVEIACETDFVAKTDEFDALCKEIAMQVVSMDPKDVEDLMAQEYIRDSSKTIDQLVKELISKTGENIRVTRFARFKLGTE